MISPLLFASCFMFIALLLLLGVIYSRVHWLLKAGLVVISLLFGAGFYRAHMGTMGYPAPIAPPQLFRFVFAVIREPFPLQGDPGAIYIWLTLKDNDLPRAIAIPYSEADRKAIAEAKKRTEKGEIVYMGMAGTHPPSASQHGEQPSQSGGDAQHKLTTGPRSLPYDVHGQALEFEAPPDTVPRKDTE